MLIKSDNQLYRAYLLKENLRLCFHHPYDEAAKEPDKWLKWAQRCRIHEFTELAKKIKRHKTAILATFRTRIHRLKYLKNMIKSTYYENFRI